MIEVLMVTMMVMMIMMTTLSFTAKVWVSSSSLHFSDMQPPATVLFFTPENTSLGIISSASLC